MTILGLHLIDAAIIVIYLFAMLAVGLYYSRRHKTESDFYLGGRKLGKIFQFFLSFGNSTDANGAASVSTTVYSNGVGGVWMGLQTLFLTPFYWFTAIWFRRVRLITMGDLFVDRFGSRRLGGLYALVNIFYAVILIGVMYLATFKIMEPMLTVDPANYTAEQAQIVANYAEYQELNALYREGTLSEDDRPRYDQLANMVKIGEARPYVSYVKKLPFFIFFAVIIALYVIAGGLTAAAITDAFQGILIIIFSLMLIPLGLRETGGFSGLHEKVPEYMFLIFGSVQMSEYTWYSIGAITLGSLIQIFGLQHNMSISGSAESENAARLGLVAGTFTKRFMILGWMMCGLIAYALYAGQIPDPDNTWGYLTSQMLGPGLLGIMISGMLAANMSTIEAGVLALSALFVRNLYEPLRSGFSQQHYLFVGRIVILVVMMFGIGLAMVSDKMIPLFYTLITFGTIWGAAIVLIFFWNRLTEKAVWISVIIWVIIMIPMAWVPTFNSAFNQNENLTIETHERVVTVIGGAKQADVDAGRATRINDTIEMQHTIRPVPVFYESLVLSNPADPSSPKVGKGRFNIEIYILAKLGVPVQKLGIAELTCARWLFDSILPFVMLMVFSLFTRRTDTAITAPFYAKMRIPVKGNHEEDALQLEAILADPAQTDRLKLFPRSNWEFGKWDRADVLGFAGCWAFVGVFLGFMFWLINFGS